MGMIPHVMPDKASKPLRLYPGGLCPDCQQPACDHLDTSGMLDMGCPKDGQPLYLRQLAGSAQIETLAYFLSVAHAHYEGWPVPETGTLTGDLKRVYEQAAAYAVRFCSEVDRKVAEDRAVSYALHAVGGALMTPRFTPEGIAEGVRTAIRNSLDVYRYHLMNGCGRSPLEMFEEQNADEHAEVAP